MFRTAEFRFQHADGSWVWFESRGRTRLDDPNIEGVIVSQREITDRVEREQRLQRERDRLEEFASIVSHDLRNPLSVAEGRVKLAQRDCNSEHLDAAGAALARIDQVINRTLTLARSGQAVGETEPVDLSDLAEQCWENVDTADSNLRITDLSRIEADRDRLRHLFENLYRNSIEHGGEDVSIVVSGLPTHNGFYVEDNGPGIPENERKEVLTPGYSTTKDGTGLGLNIVKQIVEAHGWTIRVTESADGGARFEITGVTLGAE